VSKEIPVRRQVKTIPKYFNQAGSLAGSSWNKQQRKEGVVFAKAKEGTVQVIRIGLSLRPSVVVDYVVGAFKTKGWGAKHTYNGHEGFDFLDLTLPVTGSAKRVNARRPPRKGVRRTISIPRGCCRKHGHLCHAK
jgi:hypothetical protein